jgi:hypothetical protein
MRVGRVARFEQRSRQYKRRPIPKPKPEPDPDPAKLTASAIKRLTEMKAKMEARLSNPDSSPSDIKHANECLQMIEKELTFHSTCLAKSEFVIPKSEVTL